MLVEHTFVTTLEALQAMAQMSAYLQTVGFRLTACTQSALGAVRGRARANTARIAQLPQAIRVQFDRGRVNVAASITPRGGKDKPAHADFLRALVIGMQSVLAGRLTMEQAADDLRRCEVKVRTLGGAAEKVAYAILIFLGLLLVFGVILAVVAGGRP